MDQNYKIQISLLGFFRWWLF